MMLTLSIDRFIGCRVKVTFKDGFPYHGSAVEGTLFTNWKDLWGSGKGKGYAVVTDGGVRYCFRKSHVRKIRTSRREEGR